MLMQAEKPRIRSDASPPRSPRTGTLTSIALQMRKGDWVTLTHVQAKSLYRIIRKYNGSAIRYKTSDLFSVVKVLNAPWK